MFYQLYLIVFTWTKLSYFDAYFKYSLPFTKSYLEHVKVISVAIKLFKNIYYCSLYTPLKTWLYLKKRYILTYSDNFDIYGENDIWHLHLISALTWSDKETKQSVSRAIRGNFSSRIPPNTFLNMEHTKIDYLKEVFFFFPPKFDVILYLLS